MKCRNFLVAPVALAMAAGALAAPRIGDPGSVLDPAKLDPRYPQMAEWAKAGVEGGIPLRADTPVVQTVQPGEDIQAALDAAGQTGKPCVVLLAAGTHERSTPLRMRSNVILRGADRAKTVLIYDNVGSKDVGEGIRWEKVARAGLEDLTLRNARVMRIPREAYIGKYEIYTAEPGFPIGNYAALDIRGSRNCWVDNCSILDSVSRPLRIFDGSQHITVRDTLADRCLHKGGSGCGYFEVVFAKYVLFYNDTVRNIRHFCLNGGSDYAVVTHCKLQVDLNWHCIKPMQNTLVEDTTSYLHPWHAWPTLAYYIDTVEPGNYLLRHQSIWRCRDQFNADTVCDPAALYTLRTNYVEKPFAIKVDDQPKSGRLYPVTGVADPDPEEDAAKALLLDARPGLLVADDAALVGKLQVLTAQYPTTLSGYYAQDVLDIIAFAETQAAREATPAARQLKLAEVYTSKSLCQKAKAVAQGILRDYPDSPEAKQACERINGLTKAGY